MKDLVEQNCRRNCWRLSAVGAVVLAGLLKALALYSLGMSLVFGLVFFGLFGGFLIWAFCSGKAAETAPQRALVGEAADQAVLRPVVMPTPRPDPTSAAAPIPAHVAPVAAPVVAAVKPAGPKQAKAASVKAVAAKKGAPAKAAPAKAASKAVKAAPAKPPKTPRASGLETAMGRTKDATDATSGAAPVLLLQPRDDKGDDLKQIKGVGPALEKLLNTIGVWHFDQIASWKAKDIAHVDGMMAGFKGRITRDEWVKQARVLARGGTTEFSARVVKGDVY